jgi:hypothetical protein
MDSLHATIEDFAAEGYTHVECFCPRCRDQAAADELAQLGRALINAQP